MVFVGRPALWGLSVGGEKGAKRLLEILRDELDLTMALAGTPDVRDINSSYLTRRPAKILFYMGLSSHSHRVALQPLATKLASLGHEITFFSPIEPTILNANITEFCPDVLKTANDKAIKSAGDANGEEYIYAFAYLMKAKVIAFPSSATQLPADFDVFGFPIESWFTGFYSNSYWYIPDRVFNCFHTIVSFFVYRDYHLNKMESLVKTSFNFEFPPLIELMGKTDLVFLNEHFSAAYSRPLPQNIVPVGGIHVEASEGILPQEIQDFLSDTDQFIYISFGSVIKVSLFPPTVQQYFFDSIKSFQGIKFLWKWEGEVPENFPENILTRSWFPQQDILAHPKCKGFITQGGQMKTLSHSIDELLHNRTYRDSAQEVSKRFRDRPMSALDTAVWWTEYVLRHDTSHLSSLSQDVPTIGNKISLSIVML
ncbi:unnamed protein product [Allacma fusca]|uniref:FMN-dependent dehydrogenase domain-containing protein n=1 Tax=Allacma fusca TaxID=39272 RepID=A0A8J2LHK8_9HEXA|nr:unnamed protein product [Allacma fusca]